MASFNLLKVTVPAIVATILFTASSSFSTPADGESSSDDSPAVRVTDIKDKTRINHIVDQVKTLLGSLGSGSTVACKNAIDVVIEGPGHDYSYGASCAIYNGSQKTSALVCDDTMIGKFTFTIGGPDNHTREGISHFVLNNCPPGG